MTTVLKIPLHAVQPGAIRDLQEKYPKAQMQINISDEPGAENLDEHRFWELINLLDWSKEGDDEAVVEPLVAKLTSEPVRTIYDFQDWLSAKLYALDKQVFAEQIGEDAYHPDRYFSVDNFLYARACVVANGHEAYQQVLQNPEMMPKDLTFEAIIHAASDAYERKTGKYFDYVPVFPIETYSNPEGWK